MEINKKKIIDKIKHLPPLPQIVTILLEKFDNPDTSSKEIAEIMQKDQSLVAETLKIVNSPYYGLRNEVVSVYHAINILGYRNMKSLIMAIKYGKLFNRHNENHLILWQHSFSTALFSRYVSKELNYKNIEEIFVCGLLHDIGKLAIYTNLDDKYRSVIERVKAGEGDFYEIEREVFGFTHLEVGAFVAERWRLSSLVKNSTFFHKFPDMVPEHIDVVAIVNIANYLSHFSGFSFYEIRDEISIYPFEGAKILGVSIDKITEIYKKYIDKVSEEMKLF